MTREQFAARLRAAREATGLTQDQAAAATGIHRVTYVRYETGVAIPSIIVACDLIDRIGLDPATIFPEYSPETRR